MRTPLALTALTFLLALPAFSQSLDPEEESAAIRSAREQELASYLSAKDGASCPYVSGIPNSPPLMRVALTFDDGPDPQATPYVLDVLRRHHASATFFLVGRMAAAYPDLVQRILKEGHMIVGNHTWSHPDFHKITVAQQTAEVKKNIALLGQYQNPKFFRYPYGNATCATNSLLHSLGYRIVGWHVDSCDWAYDRTGSVPFRDAVLCKVQPENRSNFVGHVLQALHARGGGILLMHEIHPRTIRKLDVILEQLVHDGFTFGSIDEAGFRASLR